MEQRFPSIGGMIFPGICGGAGAERRRRYWAAADLRIC